jgi:hypothetical protein
MRFARRALPLLPATPVIQSVGLAKGTDASARRSLVLLLAFLLFACPKPEPLTKQKAEEIIHGYQFTREPVYAEVPQKVWWNARYPKDDFDEKSLRTFDNLQRAGYLTYNGGPTPDGGAAYVAKVTSKGFSLLGTAPSVRGPVFRGMICFKRYDGIRDFQRHPNEPTTGRAELVWHYDEPTQLYPLFDTKLNKPLKKPFASLVSFYWKDYDWHFDVTVRKTEVGE